MGNYNQEELRALLEKNQIEDLILCLKEIFSDTDGNESLDALTNIYARYNRMEKDRNLKNIISYEFYNQELNNIVNGLNQLIRGLPSSFRGINFRPIPKPPYCFGRDAEIERIEALLTGKLPTAIHISGAPGCGKTTLSLTMLHQERIIDRYQSRRFFVRCEHVYSYETLLIEIQKSIGLKPAINLEDQVYQAINEEPLLLLLDNIENFIHNAPGDMDHFLEKLSGMYGLAIIVTTREGTPPFGLHWQLVPPLHALEKKYAKELFLKVSNYRFTADSEIEELIDLVDGHPLSVYLIAKRAIYSIDLKRLVQQWNEQGGILFEPKEARVNKFEKSIGLALQNPNISEEGKTVFTILSGLPEGVADDDINYIAPNFGKQGVKELLSAGLAFQTNERIRLLSPIREFANKINTSQQDQFKHANKHYLSLILDLRNNGNKIERQFYKKITDEWRNIVTSIERILKGNSDLLKACQAATVMGNLFLMRGLANPTELLEKVINATTKSQTKIKPVFGDLHLILARINFNFLDFSKAREQLKLALNCYNQLDYSEGSIMCNILEGEIEMAYSEYSKAKKLFAISRISSKDKKFSLGIAYSTFGLGNAHYKLAAFDVAEKSYQEAKIFFESSGDLSGDASCSKGLGDVFTQKKKYITAKEYYRLAIKTYDKIGALMGIANCKLALGDVCYLLYELQSSEDYYREALDLYQKMKIVMGQAGCYYGLAEIAYHRTHYGSAEEYCKNANSLYAQVNSQIGIAACLTLKGNIASKFGKNDDALMNYLQAEGLYRSMKDTKSADLCKNKITSME